MKIPSRHIPTKKAERELAAALVEIVKRHELTSFEILMLLNQQAAAELILCLMDERKPNQ